MKSYDRSYSRGTVSYRGHFVENPRFSNAEKLSDKQLPQGKGDNSSNFSMNGLYQNYLASGQPVLQCTDLSEAVSMDPSLQYSDYYDTLQKRASREHDIVVLAVNPALKAYGQMITDTIEAVSRKKGQDFLKDFFADQQSQGAKPKQFHYRKPKVFQVSLGGENYVEPCIMDFNDKGYLYAIICNEANKRHGSVTLRILHSDQEHRNMPMTDSMDLLFNDFNSYIHTESEYLAAAPLPLPTPTIINHPPPLPSTKQNHQGPPPTPVVPTPLHTIQQAPAPQRSPEVTVSSQLEPNSSKPQRRFSPPSLTRRRGGRSSIEPRLLKRHRSSRSSSHSSSRSAARGYSRHFGPPQSSHHRSSSSLLHGQHQRQPGGDIVEIPVPDDPSFLVPSKRMSALLRMLADSRILSAAELDEIAKFVAERKARLNSTVEEHKPAGNSSNDALKARILETIYNQTPSGISNPLDGSSQSQQQVQQQSSQQQLPFQTQQLGFSSRNRALLEPSHPALPSLLFSGPNPLFPSFSSNTNTSNLITIPTRGPSQFSSLLSSQKSLPMSRAGNDSNNPNSSRNGGNSSIKRRNNNIATRRIR
nr:expressed protein [Hymenolepis microstoma]